MDLDSLTDRELKGFARCIPMALYVLTGSKRPSQDSVDLQFDGGAQGWDRSLAGVVATSGSGLDVLKAFVKDMRGLRDEFGEAVLFGSHFQTLAREFGLVGVPLYFRLCRAIFGVQIESTVQAFEAKSSPCL